MRMHSMPTGLHRPTRGAVCALALAAYGVLYAGSALAQNAGTDDPDTLTITLNAESTEASGRDGALAFRGIRVTQGDLSISADLANASGLDFRSSQWTFEGNVRFASAGSTVTAGRAVLAFEDQQLVSADLSGPPVRFTQELNGSMALSSREARLEFRNRTLARARFNGAPVTYRQNADDLETMAQARRIVIDQRNGTIDLRRDASIKEGSREIRGDQITYNYLARSVTAASESGSDERVTIMITPPAPSTETPPPSDEGGAP
ncbi:MAG: LptA/OstA family protein [Pseudomonadota bacterium]